MSCVAADARGTPAVASSRFDVLLIWIRLYATTRVNGGPQAQLVAGVCVPRSVPGLLVKSSIARSSGPRRRAKRDPHKVHRLRGAVTIKQQRVVVLQSFPQPRATSNPYVAQLAASMPSEIGILTFSWPRAIFGRWDVFHVHWPEILMRGSSWWRSLGRQALTLWLLFRIRFTGKPMVRTLHNVRPHEPQTRVQSVLLWLLDRWTSEFIKLTPCTVVARDRPQTVILHGHYRDWFARYTIPDPVPGRLLFFGFIRPYKQVENLLSAFQSVGSSSLTLHVVGQPQSHRLAASVRNAAAGDARITLRLDHRTDAELTHEIGESELVVLAYREMTNSGAALLALSLDRPVLLPGSEATRQLADEVGPGWVLCFDGELQGTTLRDALDAVRKSARSRGERPDLSRRQWRSIGQQHADVYSSALVRRAARSRCRG